MSDSNQVKHKDLLHIGPCLLMFYDEVNDHLVKVGRVDNIAFEKLDAAPVFAMDIINGRGVEVLARATEEKYRLHGKFVEVLDPNTLYLFMKDCGTPVHDPLCDVITLTEEYTVFNDRCILLARNNGFLGSGNLPAPATVSATFGGSGGTIPADDYTFVVTGVYGGAEGAYIESPLYTITATQEAAVTVVVAGTLPEALRFYVYNDSQTRADAIKIYELDSPIIGSNLVNISAFVDLGEYPGDEAGSFSMTDANGIPYVVNIDYTVDDTCGLICFPETGAICNGQRVWIRYASRRNPKVSMRLGSAKTNPKIGNIVLLSLQDDDRITPVPKGIEIQLYRVVLEGGWNVNLSEISFNSGFEFNWPVLLDDRTLSHGYFATYNRHFECYEVINWGALTQAAEACLEAGS